MVPGKILAILDRQSHHRGEEGLVFIDHAQSYVEGPHEPAGELLEPSQRDCPAPTARCQPFHLHRYIDEQIYRYNARQWVDVERFAELLGQVEHRRVTHKSAHQARSLVSLRIGS
jgi:hypothetical protein